MRLFVTGGSGFIGTNLVDYFSDKVEAITNYDLQPPFKESHGRYWQKGDLLDKAALAGAISDFRPDAVIHLAGRAETDETTTVEIGYRANTEGTANMLAAVQACPSVRRLVVTSSQFVCGPGPLPAGDEDYFPCTVYGQSKVITEQLTRSAGLACCWTIIRPTNIWGPWHQRYVREFWNSVRRGVYVHPGGRPVFRSYGYVGNVVRQIARILELPAEEVSRQTFYVGDPPGDIKGWTDAFSRALAGRPVRVVPRGLLWLAGLAGDVVSFFLGKPFLINSSRYRSMTTDYPTPMEKTFEVLGPAPVTLEEGVAETAAWLRTHQGWSLPRS